MTACAAGGGGHPYRVTFRRVVRAEWTKLTSLRSTWFVLGGVAVLAVGFAAVMGWVADREAGPARTPGETLNATFLSVDILSLVVGVFGILLMTGEYSSGSIRATLTAVPGRTSVLGAKALVLVGAAAPMMLVVCALSFVVGQAFTTAASRLGFGDPDVLRATVGAAAAPVALGLIGLGIGALVRHTAGAITTYVAAMLVVPALLPAALPGSLRDTAVPYVPVAAAQAMYAGQSGGGLVLLSPGTGALVLIGWIVAVLVGGAVMLRRRDA